jgi:hypothetical protein
MTNEEIVAALREKAHVLYDGKRVEDRSCGCAIAEAFDVPARPYQVLRRGGLTGEGHCGAMLAGELILSDHFGHPDPWGPPTPALRDSILWYRAELARRADRGGAQGTTCNALLYRFPQFGADERHAFCLDLVTVIAEVLAEAILCFGGRLEPTPIPAR